MHAHPPQVAASTRLPWASTSSGPEPRAGSSSPTRLSDGHAVPAPVAVVGRLVAEVGEGGLGEGVVGLLGLLQADDVGLVGLHPLHHQRQAGTERVDVPGGEPHAGQASRIDEDEEEVGLAGRLPADVGPAMAGAGAGGEAADGHLQLERLARHHLAAEPGPFDPAEERQLARVARIGQHGDPPSWASDSTISTPGRVGRPGK